MHSQYLRGLFLENRLTAGRFAVEGRVIALKDLRVPMFVVGTETDHIAPWQSVYKAHLFTDNELTFVLTNGGHNTGIVSEPGHAGRRYDIATRKTGDRYVDAATWRSRAARIEGSWWPEWDPQRTASPAAGAPARGIAALCPAPGTFCAPAIAISIVRLTSDGCEAARAVASLALLFWPKVSHSVWVTQPTSGRTRVFVGFLAGIAKSQPEANSVRFASEAGRSQTLGLRGTAR
jgi:hypothetical protein